MFSSNPFPKTYFEENWILKVRAEIKSKATLIFFTGRDFTRKWTQKKNWKDKPSENDYGENLFNIYLTKIRYLSEW